MTGKARQRAEQVVVRIVTLGTLAHTLDDTPAKLGVLDAHRLAGGPAHGGPRLAGGNQRFPCGWRSGLGLGGENLDFIAVLQFGRQRCDLAVDLAADRMVADICMHRISKIDRGRIARQSDQLAFGGKAEHLVLEKLELGVLEKFFRVGTVREQRDGAAPPRIGIRFPRQEFDRRACFILVEGVSRDAVLGDVLHLLGANLQLDALVARPDHGCVDRAIIVLLGGRDVVLEPTGHHRPGGVDDTKSLIAFRHALHDDDNGLVVGQLLESDRFALHLAPDRIGTLAAARDDGRDAAIGELAGELHLDLGDQPKMPLRQGFQALTDHLMGFRVEFAERQFYELFAQLVHPDAARERRVNVDGFFGDPAARLGRHVLDGAHVVQPVGELDQQHAHILGDRQQQLAQIFGLLGLTGDKIELFQFREALDQTNDIFAEPLLDLGARSFPILDGVVQQRGRDGGVVELVLRENRGDLERMGDIRVSGKPFLLAMSLHGIDIGAIKEIFVRIGIILTYPIDEVILPHQRLGTFRRRRRIACCSDAGGRPRRHLSWLRRGLHARQIGGLRHRGSSCTAGGAARTRLEYHEECTARQQFTPQCKHSISRHRRAQGGLNLERPRLRPSVLTSAPKLMSWWRTQTRSPDSALYICKPYSSSSGSAGSGRTSGGAKPSRPLSNSSSVIRSAVISMSSASTPPPAPAISGIASGSGSSTSTYFCSEWMRSSLRSPGEMVVSAISRNATTGFLSLSRSMVICAPEETIRARWLASRTSSNRFSTLSMQSSTVTRAMGPRLQNVRTSRQNAQTSHQATILVVCMVKYRLPNDNARLKLVVIRMTAALHWAWRSRKALLADHNGGLAAIFSHDGASWQATVCCARFRNLNSVARSVGATSAI